MRLGGHANRGKGWEGVLVGWHDLYARRGDPVAVYRTPAPVKQLGRMGAMRREGASVIITPANRKAGRRGGSVFPACYESEGPPDFMGVAFGRFITFDAKQHLSGDRFPFAQIPDHQATAMDAAVAAGGYAFLAVQLQLRSYLVWWDRLSPHWWRWRREGGRPASLKPSKPDEGMEGCAVRLPSDGWLPVLRERLHVDAELAEEQV